MSNLNSCQISLSKHMHQLLANQLSLDVCVLCVCCVCVVCVCVCVGGVTPLAFVKYVQMSVQLNPERH